MVLGWISHRQISRVKRLGKSFLRIIALMIYRILVVAIIIMWISVIVALSGQRHRPLVVAVVPSPVARRGNRGSAEVSVLSHLLPSSRLTPQTTLSVSLSSPFVDILTYPVEAGESLGGELSLVNLPNLT